MLHISKGACHVLFAYDIAFSIDLRRAETLVREATQRETIRHRRRAPASFQYEPAPVRFSQGASVISVGGRQTNPSVDYVLYDFGGVSVIYTLPLDGALSDLLALSDELYENPILLEDSRRRVEQLLTVIEPAVSQPSISEFVEDYIIFQVDGFVPRVPIQDLIAEHSGLLAQTLRAETRILSDDERWDSLAQRVSFSADDTTIVDWNAAIVVDQEPEDVLVVLEFANVELMEMRYLDHRLDRALSLAYDALSRKSWRRFPFGSKPAELHRIALWQVDSAMLFEGVNNALKLLGDQYLARLYRAAAERFHLTEWDSSIMRKLETLDSIYGKISDQVASRRMEALEWIIIALIAVSIALPFFVGFRH
jgi:hypothetical protein